MLLIVVEVGPITGRLVGCFLGIAVVGAQGCALGKTMGDRIVGTSILEPINPALSMVHWYSPGQRGPRPMPGGDGRKKTRHSFATTLPSVLAAATRRGRIARIPVPTDDGIALGSRVRPDMG